VAALPDRRVGVVVSLPAGHVTADGLAGHGEVCPLGTRYLPAFAEGARAALRELAPHLLGRDPCQLGPINAVLDAALRGHAPAKSALDIACWDLFGQATGQSVARLLGGRYRDEYELYIAIQMGTPAEMAARVAAFQAQGYRQFQLKVGGDPRDDVARVRAVLAQAGPGGTVVVDANGGWTQREAALVARALDGLDVYLEQPCATLEECLAIRARTSLPFILDEVMTGVQPLLRAAAARAMDGINLKLARVGGLTRARQMRDLCDSLDVSLTIEDAMGGDIASAAIAHLVASTNPARVFSASVTNAYVVERIAEGAPRAERAHARIPDGPGLGIRVDESRLGQPLFSVA
jgi:L-alanine-DL-glutamate epimerase-like enolase superfamily enzyme